MFRILLLSLLVICALSDGADIYRSAENLQSGRIVGGQDSNIEDFPFQLSLQIQNWHVCGAAIISEDWAVTAAHCIYEIRPNGFYIRAGNSNNSRGSVHQVAEFIWHPKFDPWSTDYDYGLIKVNNPFLIGVQPGVGKIELSEVEPKAGEVAVASGWGALWSGGPTPDILQNVALPIISRKICRNQYKENEITDRMLCAGLEKGGKGSCQGDTGGPLIVKGKLVGIASWSFSCAYPKRPGVYTNVANQIDWIRQVTGV